MANRIFVCAVILLWIGSMSWLLVDKILPSFHEGEPPIAAGYEPGVPIAWKVLWGDREVGYAASKRTPGVLGTTNLENRVVLEDVPLLDLVPALMRRVVGDIGSMKFDAKTTLEFDSLDNFSKFDSYVEINDVSSVLELHGKVNGAFLDVKVTFGDVRYEPKVPIASQAALSEALFPDAKLPYLYVGRRWTEEIYNPFHAPNAPIETVDVEVTGIETLSMDGENHRVMRVEFSGPPAPGVPEDARLQAIAWVRESDGVVLRQDVLISTSKLRFDRLPEKEALKQGNKLLADSGYHRRGWGGRRHGKGGPRPDGVPSRAWGEWKRPGEQRPAELPSSAADGPL
jgi:hypothetical protein